MHPFVKILLFTLVLLFSSAAKLAYLATVACILLLAAFIKHQNFLLVLVRVRWLLLSIILVYAFATPGELLPLFPLYAAPSYEGLMLGLTQLCRILIALAALHLLLSGSSKQALIAGLYMWLLPLKCLGLNVKLFAARLMLTLHYVEALAEQDKQRLSFTTLHQAFEDKLELPISTVHLQRVRFSLLDKSLLFLISVMLTVLIYKVFS